MSPAIISIIMLIACAFSVRGGKTLILILSFLLLAISVVIGFRSLTVPDTEGYMENYLYQTDFFNLISSPYEKGYTLFMRTCYLVFGEWYQLFFTLLPVINFCIVLKAFKIMSLEIKKDYAASSLKSKVPFSAFTLFVTYFSFYGLYHNAIVLRFGMASSLLLLSLAYMLSASKITDYIRVFLIFVLAVSFHTSTLVCLPMFWLAKHGIKFSVTQFEIILALIFVIYMLSPYLSIIMAPVNQILSIMSASGQSEFSKFDYYSDASFFESSGISFKFLFYYCFAWLFVLKNDKRRVWNRLLGIYLTGLLIWAILRPLLLVERVVDFYIFIYVILAAIYFFPRKDKRVKAGCIVLLPSFQLLFIFRIINNMH